MPVKKGEKNRRVRNGNPGNSGRSSGSDAGSSFGFSLNFGASSSSFGASSSSFGAGSSSFFTAMQTEIDRQQPLSIEDLKILAESMKSTGEEYLQRESKKQDIAKIYTGGFSQLQYSLEKTISSLTNQIIHIQGNLAKVAPGADSSRLSESLALYQKEIVEMETLIIETQAAMQAVKPVIERNGHANSEKLAKLTLETELASIRGLNAEVQKLGIAASSSSTASAKAEKQEIASPRH